MVAHSWGFLVILGSALKGRALRADSGYYLSEYTSLTAVFHFVFVFVSVLQNDWVVSWPFGGNLQM